MDDAVARRQHRVLELAIASQCHDELGSRFLGEREIQGVGIAGGQSGQHLGQIGRVRVDLNEASHRAAAALECGAEGLGQPLGIGIALVDDRRTLGLDRIVQKVGHRLTLVEVVLTRAVVPLLVVLSGVAGQVGCEQGRAV